MVLVRHWFVLAGLIMVRLAALVIGISARATLELNGPIMPKTLELEIRSRTFWAPFWASCVPLTESSLASTVSLKPPTEPFSCTAYLTPFSGGRPCEHSAPGTGQ